MTGTIRVKGLKELQVALKGFDAGLPRSLTKALKQAAEGVAQQARSEAPRRTGRLAAGYKASAAGLKAQVVNRVPYAAGAEYGRFKRWSGFAKYGGFGERFATKAFQDRREEIAQTVEQELLDLARRAGWKGR